MAAPGGEMSVPGSRPGGESPAPNGDRRSRLLGGGSGRSTWIAVISTVVFFSVLAFLVVNSPGWSTVRFFFFDGAEFAYAFPELLA